MNWLLELLTRWFGWYAAPYIMPFIFIGLGCAVIWLVDYFFIDKG